MSLAIRNLVVAGRPRRERLPEQLTTAAWHRLSFAEDGPVKVRETGETIWTDVQPVPDDRCDGMVLRARFADTRTLEVRRRDGTRKLLKRPGASTGGRDPYALAILTDGSIDQLAELGEITPHAGAFNIAAAGIAVIGDFTVREMTAEQWQTSVTLAALLSAAWDLDHNGHTMLGGGASADPSKVCPGSFFPMVRLRTAARAHELAALDPLEAEAILLEAGLLF